ncbi:MAG TPA: efflux RND transporter periplasmic adaptor subunit [Terracidiphilus sp.]|jgi:RND family efflux transporter MFP subunit|nr:efflux RND transporter periplasmic adaptor subunit [Terracidiphilus sp.]
MKSVLWASVLAASATMIAGCHDGEPAVMPGTVQTMQAQIVESQQQRLPVAIQSTGTVRSRETAVVSAQVMGRIQQVLVHEGDNVRAGQTLVVLDVATLRAQVDQAQAGVKAAENAQAAAQTNSALAASTLARYKQLESQKSVSPQEMDEVSQRAEAAAAGVEALRAQADAARAQESSARTMLGYTRLVAPFAGVVTARMADPGTMAAPGVALLQVDQAAALQLQATVDQSVIDVVHKGMKVKVAIEGGAPTSLAGTVAEIVPAADLSSHGFLVKIDLPPSNQMRAGMYGTAEFPNGEKQAILIPRSTVVARGSLNCVYVLDDHDIAQLRSITLGAAQGNFVEVLSGVSAGEKLVDAPSDRELAGKRIENSNGARP